MHHFPSKFCKLSQPPNRAQERPQKGRAEAKNLEGNQNGEMHDTPKERCLYSRGCYVTRILKAEKKPARDRELCEKP